MIAVFVVDGKEVFVVGVKFSSTLGTDQSVDFQRLLPVVAGRKFFLLQFFDDFFNRFTAIGLLEPSQFVPALVWSSHRALPPYEGRILDGW